MNKILILAGLCALILAGLAFSASNEDQSTPNLYRRAWSGTITNAGNDTLTVPVTLSSLWTYNYVVDAASTSGTRLIVTILQESNANTGNIWYEVERDTVSAGTRLKRLHGLNVGQYVKGQRQRLILDGVGTQVSPYTATLTAKKLN
jgi:hypothetical protein